MDERTIAAISTAYGEAGIGIVRMSGPGALSIARRIFIPAKSENEFGSENAKLRYGNIVDPENNEILDEVLCVYMRAPHTYTGEDLVEIQCHGSVVALKNILSLCLKNGAVSAERGEFTKLAFLNGRIDLAQAEAVIDLIKARTSMSFDTALSQMGGSLSRKVKAIRNELMELLVKLTVNMDYPDEDIEEITLKNIADSLSLIDDELSILIASGEEGKIIREGLSVAIVGKPNVGKSSLMNIFLGEARSIVTDIPGTTRDTIEESLSLRGIPVRLTDTAGIHETEDLVEGLGIERSKDAFNKADLVLLILDSSSELSEEDKELLLNVKERPCIICLNKSDLKPLISAGDIKNFYPGADIIETSFALGKGVEELKDKIEGFISGGEVRREDDVLVTNVRHQKLLEDAQREVREAIKMAESQEAMDFIEVNCNAAFMYLGEITGDTATGEIIDEVFSRFCLGK